MQESFAFVRKSMGVYQIKCLPNGLVYVGSSIDIGHRWVCHRTELNRNIHDNQHLQNAWNKYGGDGFEFSVIQPVINESNLGEIEERWIAMKESADRKKGFNKTERALLTFLGKTHTDETKAKISKAKKGSKQSDEVIARRAKAMIGHYMAPETSQKIWATRRANGKGGRTEANVKEMSHPVAGFNEQGEKVVEFKSIQEARRNGYYSVEGAIAEPHRRRGGLRWERTTSIDGVCVKKKAA
jgi:group I intron endonuclease